MEPDNLGEQLSAYVDGELTDAERAEVERLLESDPSARAELERLREAASWVRDLPKRSAPAGLADEVMARVQARPTPTKQKREGDRITRGFIGFRPFVLAAAMVAISVGIGLWGVSQGGKAGSEQRLAVAERKSLESQDLLGEKSRRKGPSEERSTRSPAAAFEKSLSVDSDEVDAGKGGARWQGGEAAPSVSIQEYVDSVGSQIGTGAPRESIPAEPEYEEALDDSIGVKFGKRKLPSDSGLVFATSGAGANEKAEADRAALKVEVVFRERSDLEISDLKIRKLNFADVRTTPARVLADENKLIRRHLVTVPRSQLPQVFATLDMTDANSRMVSVAVGDLVRAEGWNQTQQLLAMVAPEPKVEREESMDRSTHWQVFRPTEAPPADANVDIAAGETRANAESSVPQRSARRRGAEPGMIEGGAKGITQDRASADLKKVKDAAEDYLTIDLRLISPAARPN